MLKVQLLISLVSLLLWLFALVDAITSSEDRVRHLSKGWWIVIVLFFPLVGSVAWLVAGRPEGRSRAHHGRPDFPEYDRPGRFVATDEARDADFLRQVRERAEEQRRRYEAQHESGGRAAGEAEPEGQEPTSPTA